MRKLKKVAAVLLTAAMTLSASVMAFADTTVTFHFQNGKNWEEVGGYIFQGIAWTTNVTDNSVVTVKKADGTVKKLWPGARCTEEKEGWYTCTATFTDTVTKDGIVMKFNNLVGDAEVNTTTEQDDVDAMLASGLKTTQTATKEETEAITINKKNAILAGGTIPTDIYIEYDGKIATATAEAPESYKNAAALGGSTTTDNNASTTTDNNAGTTTPSANKTETVKDVVTESEAADIEKQVVVEGVEETDKIKVSKVQDDSADHKILDQSSELVGTKFAVLDLKLVRDNQNVQPGKAIKVTIPVMQSLKDAKYVEVFRVDSEKSSMESLGIVSVVDGKITFETSHFSTYVFVQRTNSTGTKAPTTGDTAAVSIVLLGLASAVAVVASKKKVNA